jgi:guanylate kinase
MNDPKTAPPRAPDTHPERRRPARGLLFVISSPSGAGKTTLTRRLAQTHGLAFSVSYTTRKPRAGEVDGRDYHFVSDDRFSRMVDANEFAEWAYVHGNRYGTSIATVNEALDKGTHCLFDVDFQGGGAIKRLWSDDSVLCFILPPSMRELERRLRQRATDAPEVIERRLETARRELEHYAEYDYLVVNDDIDEAFGDLSAIYRAALCARPRNEAWARALLEEARAGGTAGPAGVAPRAS